ncbi:hypothetical protein J8F10_08600 [Gemmata sp. G18]|uniref:Uncharacterized protein n=1 Tax=Gemmata palustris TaxID=2822762 RepID=A0ABS5BNN3_9BACT|nr:hypothetical protein [Gemmata palustris]MBP3955338.1 hypothetical protein [Gemmata palustris]
MTVGDSNEWDGFLEGGGVSAVLELTLEAWDQISPPVHDELEEAVSIRLYAAMLKKRDRQAHRFLIRYEDVEIDVDLAKETGRKDIVFFPGHDGSYYYCLEAKRLNARVDGVMKSLADQYIKEGMQRFVDGKYSRHVDHGGMIGYVLDGDVTRAMDNVLKNIKKHHLSLGLEAPGEWEACPYRPNDTRAKESRHTRADAMVLFRLQHLFVSAMPAPPKAKAAVKAKVKKAQGKATATKKK